MGIKDKLGRLEAAARHETVAIPQRDGKVKRFPASELRAAFLNLMGRLDAGENAPSEPPLLAAARNSDDPE